MDQPSVHDPLLSSGSVKSDYVTKKFFLVSLVQIVLKVIMWAFFLAWVTLIVLYPAEFMQGLNQKWILATSGTVFGISGSIFLIFSGPIIIIAFISIAYLIAFGEEDLDENKNTKFPRFRLWTFPVLVDGPFGVVSAAELIGIFLFAAYILWAFSAYLIQNLSLLSKFQLDSKEKSYLMLELSGLRFGTIGLFCLAFLFLPIARGSVLLRMIDIPFEHATRYHIWLGHLTMMIFTLHGLCYIVAWAIQGRLLNEILQWRDIGVANLPGVISLVAGLMMWVTSLQPVRRHYFELFFYTHQLYVVFVIFFALHIGDFIFCISAGGIFLFLLDRFLRFCQSRKTVNIISASCLPCGTVELVLSKPGNMRYNALSFIFIQVRELSWLQWHPFSVSSSPLDGRYHLSVLIKVLGGWTLKLRDKISNIPENGPQEELPVQSHSRITASVEGPYGHESAYHLMYVFFSCDCVQMNNRWWQVSSPDPSKPPGIHVDMGMGSVSDLPKNYLKFYTKIILESRYENLILVAGGIGISPFLAILSDILHRIKERKPCLAKKILVVWAVKTSKELSLISAVDAESICPSFSDKLQLEIQIYVTQESEPPLEEGKFSNSMNSFPIANGSSMSGLVGTGNNIWSGIYVILSTVGFIVLMGLVDLFYIKPFNISSWWFKGLLFVVCMFASVIVFGGLVVVLWNLWERRILGCEKCMDDNERSDLMQYKKPIKDMDAIQTNLTSSSTTQYGRRPDFREIFESISEHWGHVDVGVIVCGPPTLQSSIAKECRSQNLRGKWNQPVFHFNSHSFDL